MNIKMNNQPAKKIILIISLSLITITSPVWAGKLLDRVVAVVNDDVITLSELNEEALPFLNQIKKEVPESQQEEQFLKTKQEILEKMIDQELIRQEAEKEHISVSEAEIDETMARIAANNNATVEEIKNKILSSGASVEIYRNNIRLQILRSKLIGRKIRAKTVVSEEQIKDYYENIYKGSEKEGYHLLQFAAGWDEMGRHESKEEAGSFAETMRKKIENGATFSEIASEYSDLPSAAEGGDIGFFKENELAPYMWQAIRDLQPGELSPVIETNSGYQFFMLLGAKKDGISQKAPLEVVREDIREKLYEKSLKTRFERWTKELRENAYINKML